MSKTQSAVTVTELNQVLNERGISIETRQKLGIVADLDHYPRWLYPVYQADGKPYRGVKRVKGGPTVARYKYAWKYETDEKIELPAFYAPTNLKEAVKAAGGVAYFVAGEPDVWTLIEVGRENVFCSFGEGNKLGKLPGVVKALNIDRLICFIDPDKRGWEAGAALYQMLAKHEIPFSMHKVPGQDAQRAGYDLNALWCDVEHDPQTFIELIDHAQHYSWDDLSEYAPPESGSPSTKSPKHAGRVAAWYDDWCETVIQAAAQKWGFDPPNGKEFSPKHSCPFHDDQDPSAQLNYRTAQLVCHGECNRAFSTDDLAGMLDVPSWKDWKADRAQSAKKGARSADTSHKGKHTGPPGASAPGRPRVAQSDKNGADQENLPQSNGVTMYGSKAAAATVRRYLTDPMFDPIQTPYPPLARLGGFANVLIPRKQYAIIGAAGMGKTALTYTMLYNLARRPERYLVFVWGPENDSAEQIMTEVARRGGPGYMQIMQHQMWLQEERRGVPQAERSGKRMSDQDRARYEKALTAIENYPGQVIYLDKSDASIHDLGMAMADKAAFYEQQGYQPVGFAIDYIQRAGGPEVGWKTEEQKAKMTANIAAKLGWFSLITSQVKKDDSAKLRSGDDLTNTSMQGLGDAQVQLGIAIVPDFAHDGGRLESARLIAVKNNMGPVPAIVRVKTALNRQAWLNDVLPLTEDDQEIQGDQWWDK